MDFPVYLQKHTVTGGNFSHVSSCGGKYYVKPEEEQEFLNRFALYVRNTEVVCTLIEIKTEIFAFFIDIDLKSTYHSHISQEEYHTISLLINKYVEKAIHELYPDFSYSSITAHVTKSQKFCSKKQCFKHGLHYYYPDIHVTRNDAKEIRNVALEYIKCDSCLSKLGDWNTIFDNSVYNNNTGIRMFGACSSQQDKARYEWFWSSSNEPNDAISKLKATSIRRYNVNPLLRKNDTVDKYFINTNNKRTSANNDSSENKKAKTELKNEDTQVLEDNIIKCISLVKMLNPEVRFADHNSWIKVCFAVKTACGVHSDKVFPTIEECTKQCTKYKNGLSPKKLKAWQVIKSKPDDHARLNLGSLIKWVKEDSPQQYFAFRKELCGLDYLLYVATQGHKVYAELMHTLCKDVLVFSAGVWYYFEKYHWNQVIPDTVRKILSDAIEKKYIDLRSVIQSSKNNKDYENTLNKAIKNVQDARFITCCMQFAKGFFDSPHFASQLDKTPYLFGTANGVLNMNTNELSQGNPSQMVSLHSTVVYDKHADCPTFKRFILEIMDNNSAVVEFLQKLFGYYMSGYTSEEINVVMYGKKGRNGKSKLIEIIRLVLSNAYSCTMSIAAVQQKKFVKDPNAPSPFTMNLEKKRLVVGSETRKKMEIDAEFAKLNSGGDSIGGRLCHSNEQKDFTPTHKLLILTNFYPVLDTADDALLARFILVNFPLSYRKTVTKPYHRPVDIFLFDKLKTELPGILNWMIEGYLKWKEAGSLTYPAAVADATNLYKKECNPFSSFVENRCIAKEGLFTKVSDLYAKYNEWASINNAPIYFTISKFSRAFKKYGFTKTKCKGERCFVGIGL